MQTLRSWSHDGSLEFGGRQYVVRLADNDIGFIGRDGKSLALFRRLSAQEKPEADETACGRWLLLAGGKGLFRAAVAYLDRVGV